MLWHVSFEGGEACQTCQCISMLSYSLVIKRCIYNEGVTLTFQYSVLRPKHFFFLFKYTLKSLSVGPASQISALVDVSIFIYSEKLL